VPDLPRPDLERLLTGYFRPERTALLVVDVQNDFCAPGGFFDRVGHPLGMVHEAVDRIEALLPQARAAGVTPIFIRAIYDEPYVSEAMRARHVRGDYPLDVCISDQWGSEFFRVAPEPDDLIVVKHRYSAFINTDLPLLLRSREITSLVLCGVATNVCVESTARDAFMLDHHWMVVSDCCGTYSRSLHDATLENIHRSFGVGTTSDELMTAWESAVAQGVA
jgi:ureidoacrylate peracid hydrolase